jgi:hypothetical protein
MKIPRREVVKILNTLARIQDAQDGKALLNEYELRLRTQQAIEELEHQLEKHRRKT